MKLPTDLSGQELRRALERIGFVYQRQKGSHMVLRREDPSSRVVIPDHKTLRPGTLRQILHEAGITVEQLKELL
jgi:predicted RNA binding protein YcfA (HicA-like mRNA interferase family)